ncbi:bifunctional diaminohydroxyphosphoribosylaminopyrimidine deaminase/5-amino-6-(5-phosphoribosylamino)uracil reductase RibD [Micromonospora rubida]|uniref:diaminohydroxyphosphoribosylaminopyrimidine deaminase n=1 Tax=Micromonospora rubida TaxID=2697657 RepID=A0ABW7SYD1_9ACTN
MASETELTAMRQAIILSSLGLGTTSPNPQVGCVILDHHGTVAGAGFHLRKGEPHAEVHALAEAGEAARGGTAVVTLEPCNHIGVTPACRQELINAGITRVVISVIDPTSRGAGGAAALAAAGIDVETNVLPDETLTVLGPWLMATRRRRPYLTWAYTVGDGGDQNIDEQLVVDLRDRADLVLAQTAIEEGIPGGHAPEHFTLPDHVDEDLRQWLSTCYTAGARTVLLVGANYADALHNNLECLDEIVITAPRVEPRQPLAVANAVSAPADFRMTCVSVKAGASKARFQRGSLNS